jgi:DNA-binding MarR family transcriptional regulator
MTTPPPPPPRDLSPSRSSRVIDNLVQKGYFIRKTSSYDRRTIAITLSSKGKKIKEEIKKNRQQMEQEIVEKFSDDEVEMIRNSLRMLLNYFM